MNLDEFKKIVEHAKDETLVKIDDSDPLMRLVRINNEGVNHGVMQMYYKILTAVYEAQTEEIRKKASA